MFYSQSNLAVSDIWLIKNITPSIQPSLININPTFTSIILSGINSMNIVGKTSENPMEKCVDITEFGEELPLPAY